MKRSALTSVLTAAASVVALSGLAFAGEPIDEKRPAASDGTVDIENIQGTVVVEGWDRDEIEVTGTLSEDADELEISGTESRTRIEVIYPRRLEALNGRLDGFWSTSGTAEILGLTEAFVLEKSGDELIWLEGVDSTPSSIRFRAEAARSYLAVSPDAVLWVAEVRQPGRNRLKDTTHQVDYLMIGPRDFLGSAGALAELRRSQGLRVKTVAVEEVFMEFGFGEETPKAIKDFLGADKAEQSNGQ